MTNTEKTLEKHTKEVIIEQIDICLSGQDPRYQLGRYIEKLKEEIIQQAEQRGREKMREALGCICKNLAPASAHFKDCPLGNCHQALAEERERVVGVEKDDLLDDMWGLIYNVNGGIVENEKPEWYEAFLRIREKYFNSRDPLTDK